MKLQGILSIAGKPGLYKIIGQTKSGVLVERLGESKRFPVPGSTRMSALEDIAIFTYEEEIPLKNVMETIFKMEEGKECISHKESSDKLKSYFETVLPDYDQDRVYISDLKKVFSWYNLLNQEGYVGLIEETATEEVENSEEA